MSTGSWAWRAGRRGPFGALGTSKVRGLPVLTEFSLEVYHGAISTSQRGRSKVFVASDIRRRIDGLWMSLN